MPPRRGVSLVEIVAVVAIVGILAGVAAPRYVAAVAEQSAAAAADCVAADLRYARRQALERSTAIAVTWEPDADAYRIAGATDVDLPSADTYTVHLARRFPGVDLTAADFAGAARLSFNHHGVPSAAGTVTLRSGSAASAVRIDASGMVEIQR
jgi:prepilin-type N-terminal cleavage/methylation domain-containing protein